MHGFKFAVALILLFAACATDAAGVRRIKIDASAAGPWIAGAVWYPCATSVQDARSDDVALSGVKDCPLSGNKLPLIVMSHGRTGWFGGHHDTAAALADAGFVVAAVAHPNDNERYHDGTDSLEVLAGRSGDIKRLVDFMLGDWPDASRIDDHRIGLFGFSVGGYTGLVVIGGDPDFRKGQPRCARTDLRPLPVCAQLDSGELPMDAPAHDSRVKAAVIVDPWPEFLLPADHLSAVSVPIQLWSSDPSHQADGVSGCCAATIRDRLPSQPEWHFVANANHFAFLALCSPKLAQDAPRICTDPPGFDRAAFHQTFHAEIIAFFRKHLNAGQKQ
ncbi:alpha/beta hydrolase family protein [Bradyrhizobium iriomotense]|uniref:Dienelactone hydrolase n=1 Tax=Bradyrhizobium iriomotense TaxID=441950 RepID=A0ABQ6APP1_9BRAD|nr:dienelactone hydrolase [Bradyrhizobium iriomotense]GLR84232.1 dienelactone hydrolase [Bradyrhizobium iriomotense]